MTLNTFGDRLQEGVVPAGTLAVDDRAEVIVISLIGEHDVVSAPALEVELLHHLDNARPPVISLDEATFIDSSVISVLFRLSQAERLCGGRLVLHAGQSCVVEHMVDISGLSAVVARCQGSLDDAVDYALTRQEALLAPQTT